MLQHITSMKVVISYNSKNIYSWGSQYYLVTKREFLCANVHIQKAGRIYPKDMHKKWS